MTKLPNWPSKLFAYVDRTRSLPFAWGERDCVLWACGAVEAMTGVDPLEKHRGTYHTAQEAATLLESLGGIELAVSASAEALGFVEVGTTLAQRGDLVLCQTGDERAPLALSVCVGVSCAGQGEHGVVYRPMTNAVRAWRVGSCHS